MVKSRVFKDQPNKKQMTELLGKKKAANDPQGLG